MFTKNIIFILSLTLLIPLNLFAASEEDKGTTTAAFLKLGIGARAAALGETYVAVANDATAPYWNPAGIIQLKKEEVATMYNKHFQGINHGYISYVRPIDERRSAIGISVIGLVVDDIEKRDAQETFLGTSKATDFAGIFSYATKASKNMAVGLNLKLIKSKIVDDSSKLSYTGDVGIIMGNGDLSFGAAYTNIGGNLKYKNGTRKEEMHKCLKAGMALLTIKRHLLLTFDVNIPNDNKTHFHGGVEYLLGGIALRIGYLTGPKDKNLGKELTGGFGIKIGHVFIDYAFVPYGVLDDSHRVSLRIRM